MYRGKVSGRPSLVYKYGKVDTCPHHLRKSSARLSFPVILYLMSQILHGRKKICDNMRRMGKKKRGGNHSKNHQTGLSFSSPSITDGMVEILYSCFLPRIEKNPKISQACRTEDHTEKSGQHYSLPPNLGLGIGTSGQRAETRVDSQCTLVPRA